MTKQLKTHLIAIRSFTMASGVKISFFLAALLHGLIENPNIRIATAVLMGFPLAYAYYKIVMSTRDNWVKYVLSINNFILLTAVFDVLTHANPYYVVYTSFFISFIEFHLVNTYKKQKYRVLQGALKSLEEIKGNIVEKRREIKAIAQIKESKEDIENKIKILNENLNNLEIQQADFKDRTCKKCGNLFDSKKAVAGHSRHCKVGNKLK